MTAKSNYVNDLLSWSEKGTWFFSREEQRKTVSVETPLMVDRWWFARPSNSVEPTLIVLFMSQWIHLGGARRKLRKKYIFPSNFEHQIHILILSRKRDRKLEPRVFLRGNNGRRMEGKLGRRQQGGHRRPCWRAKLFFLCRDDSSLSHSFIVFSTVASLLRSWNSFVDFSPYVLFHYHYVFIYVRPNQRGEEHAPWSPAMRDGRGFGPRYENITYSSISIVGNGWQGRDKFW